MPPTTAQIRELLPRGGLLHSLVRFELDGSAPQEAGVVAAVPDFPGAESVTYLTQVFGYDRWRHRLRAMYSDALAGPLPLSVDAVFLSHGREAAVFSALREDAMREYRIVGMNGRRIAVLHEGVAAGPLIIADLLLIEPGSPPRALAWNGRGFRERPLPSVLPQVAPAVSWHYGARNGAIVAQTDTVRLHVRQPLRIVASRGGLAGLVVPDPRLDLVEQGYRARRPGIYTIRVRLPFASTADEFILRVIVDTV